MTVSLAQAFPMIFDNDGQPLSSGYIYIGTANTDPVVTANRINVYFDPALTVLASQPLRTSGGYIVNGSGVKQNIYMATDFSITVKNRNGVTLWSVPSYTPRFLSAAITFGAVIVGTSIVPDEAGGAFDGTTALPWSSTVARDVQSRIVRVYDQTQPTVAADFVKINQLMLPILAVNQTSITATASWFNAKNVNTATSTQTATGAYTVVPTVALPSTNLVVQATSLDDAGLGFRSVMARIVSTTAIAVRVFIPDTATAVDGRFSLTIMGNPAVADPIS